MSQRRVAITGIGTICALGLNAQQTWESLRQGRSAIGPMNDPALASRRFHNAAVVRNYDPAAHFTPSGIDHLDRFAQFGVVAAREAVRDAGIEWTDGLRLRTAVVTGS